jgi:membrane protease YdiL (CAAX protease family)
METSEQIEKKKKWVMPVGFRIFLYMLAFFIGTGIFQFLGMTVMGVSIYEIGDTGKLDAKMHLILGLWGLIPLALFTFLFRKFLDEKSIMSMGFSIKGKAIDWLAGLIVAVLIIVLGSLLLQALGYVEIEKQVPNYKVVGLNFLLFVVVSITEEVSMRGYVLNNLLSVMNKYAALAITAVLFALMHGLNPNLTWLSMLNLFLAGIVLGATYIFTKNLWFPISLHLFWNFLQGPVLGYNVSGQTTDSLYAASPTGNPTISGGEFGFEGSIVCSVLIVLVSAFIFLYYEKKKVANES